MKYLLLGFRVELKYQWLINFLFNSQVLQSAKEQLKWSLLKWGSWDLFGIEHIQILENMRKLTSFIHRKTENNTRTIFLVKFFCSLPKIDWSILIFLVCIHQAISIQGSQTVFHEVSKLPNSIWKLVIQLEIIQFPTWTSWRSWKSVGIFMNVLLRDSSISKISAWRKFIKKAYAY